jgi:arylsulfatase A-like enzyme
MAAAMQGRRRPSVLLVVASGWRRLLPAGLTPHAERLASEGVTFPRAYTANPSAAPSLAAIRTGRYPHASRVAWAGQRVPDDMPTLEQAMRGLGHMVPELTDAGEAVTFLRARRRGDFLLTVRLPEWRRRGNYEEHCRAADEQLGLLLAELDRLRLAEETIVVFTADRGEMGGRQGLDGDGVWFEQAAGVPLLLRWPGHLASGSTQDWLWNHVDMAPTLAGLCGAAAIPDAQGVDRSALILAGGRGARPESTYVQGALGTDNEWRMLVRGWDKLVVDAGLSVTHLFNLALDRLESDNLVGDRATVRRQEELLALLRRWILKTGDRLPYPGRAPAEEQNA